MNLINQLENLDQLQKLLKNLSPVEASITNVLEVLSRAGELWEKEGKYFLKAKEYLDQNPIFGTTQDLMALEVISQLLKKENLIDRINSEIFDYKSLDDFVPKPKYKGEVFHAPLGILLHVTAGNVFLGAIDSLILGMLTKNTNLLKLSRENLFIPSLFWESIVEADESGYFSSTCALIYYDSDKSDIMAHLKQTVDGIIVWGGENAIRAYQKDLPSRARFIHHGPKISFHVITNDYLKIRKNAIHEIAKDIAIWNQQACANSQNIFISDDVDFDIFTNALSEELESNLYSQSELTANDYVEREKEYALALFEEFKTGKVAIKGNNSLVQFERGDLSNTSLNNSIKIKVFSDTKELYKKIYPYRYYLQTCGLGAVGELRSTIRKALLRAGVNRFTRPGEMLQNLVGSAHDGSYGVLELVKVCNDEKISSIDEFAQDINVPYYKNKKYEKLSDFPLIDGEILAENSLVSNQAFLNKNYNHGFVYSSGGTTGKPKFVFYTYEEFNKVCELLSESYKNLGLKVGDKVANLFMAGNMWSSFNAIQKALEYIQVVQYPMGGLVKPQDFKKYISDFKIKKIFGLPSLILELANQTQGLKIEQIFYAGEPFSDSAKSLIRKNWNCTQVISAGYASVDVGPIGYQDSTCQGGEHILFDEHVFLEIIDEEAVITSKLRKAMPVIRYRTGDKARILSQENGKTKFELLGRVDSKINIWGTRFELDELSSILKDEFQIVLKTHQGRNKTYDLLEIRLKENIGNNLVSEIYRSLKDVRDTLEFDFFSERVEINNFEFLTNLKTGKFKQINDLRC